MNFTSKLDIACCKVMYKAHDKIPPISYQKWLTIPHLKWHQAHDNLSKLNPKLPPSSNFVTKNLPSVLQKQNLLKSTKKFQDTFTGTEGMTFPVARRQHLVCKFQLNYNYPILYFINAIGLAVCLYFLNTDFITYNAQIINILHGSSPQALFG
jgi:hypothetical protein